MQKVTCPCFMCAFCDSFLCSISLLLLSAFPSCILNSVLYMWLFMRYVTPYGEKLLLFGTKREFCGENSRGLLRSNYYVCAVLGHFFTVITWSSTRSLLYCDHVEQY